MNIGYISSEVVPFAKTGGLADVAGSLPIEIAGLGHDVKVFMPKYSSISEEEFNLAPVKHWGIIPIKVADKIQNTAVYKSLLPESEVEIFFLDCPDYFDRESIYTNDPDEDERFILFSKGVMEIIQRLQWAPDIIHCNDWQTGVIPLYIKDNYSWDKLFKDTRSIFTIHNIGYQGIFPKQTAVNAEINEDYIKDSGDVEHNGLFNFLKAGISFADMINTVSPTYANELLTPELGFGMEKILNSRGLDFSGILNGVDYNGWNPETDKLIQHNYSANDFSGKENNKKQLLEQFNMPYKKDTPVIGIVSRLAIQKGFDLIARSLEYLSKLPVQWVILGSGEEHYEDMFKSFAEMRPDKAACFIGYNNELAHLIEAGSDMFLMPSKYEPCGLSQIYSLKYGTVPIVRKTGGLADTVKDWDEYLHMGEKSGDGFSFKEYNGFGLTDAVERAIKSYHNKEVWNTIIKNGMNNDYSWNKSAEKYVDLYKRALDKKQ